MSQQQEAYIVAGAEESKEYEDVGDERAATDHGPAVTSARLGQPRFEDIWYTNTQGDILHIDHAESLLDQFEDCADQPYEHPYYGIVMGTSIPRICDLYNLATARSKEERTFRLEGMPQPKFVYRTVVTGNERAILQDPSVQPENLSAASSGGASEAPKPPNPPPEPRRMLRELAALTRDSDTYKNYGQNRSRQGVAHRDQETTGNAPLVSQPKQPQAQAQAQARPPDSTASMESAVDGSTTLEISRIADGLIFIRERLGTKSRPQQGSRRPVLIFEQKIPSLWPTSNASPGKYYIEASGARRCINDARAQMMQQVQFSFHLYPTVSIIWAVGMAGRWAKFFAFTRHAVPEIDLATAASGQYPDRDLVAPVMGKIWSSRTFEYVDEQGYYVDAFKKLCHLAITTAAEQYDDEEPRSMEKVETWREEIQERIFGGQENEAAVTDG